MLAKGDSNMMGSEIVVDDIIFEFVVLYNLIRK